MTIVDVAAPIRLETDSVLARRLEAAYAHRAILFAEARATLRPESAVAMAPVAGGVAVYAGPDAPVNRAYGLGMRQAVDDEDLDRIEDFFFARERPARLDLCPLAHASLRERLQSRGYLLERFWSALVRRVTGQEQDALGDPAIEVRPVERHQQELWLHTVAEGFAGHEPPGPETLDLLRPTLSSPEITAFLAWIDGEPAGGGGLLVHDGVAECCSAGTRPAFRRRGVQAALLHARIAAAAEAGCELITAMILPGTTSERNTLRAGFQLAYTKAVMLSELPEWH